MQGTLWRAIWKVHRGTLGWTALLRLGQNITAWASPLLLQQLLEQLSGDRHPGDISVLFKLHVYRRLWWLLEHLRGDGDPGSEGSPGHSCAVACVCCCLDCMCRHTSLSITDGALWQPGHTLAHERGYQASQAQLLLRCCWHAAPGHFALGCSALQLEVWALAYLSCRPCVYESDNDFRSSGSSGIAA